MTQMGLRVMVMDPGSPNVANSNCEIHSGEPGSKAKRIHLLFMYHSYVFHLSLSSLLARDSGQYFLGGTSMEGNLPVHVFNTT